MLNCSTAYDAPLRYLVGNAQTAAKLMLLTYQPAQSLREAEAYANG